MVEHMTASNPVDVESVVRTSLTDILLDEGLALKKDTRSKCVKNWSSSGEKTLESDSIIEDERDIADELSNEQLSNEEVEENLLFSEVAVSPPPSIHPFATLVPVLPAMQVFTAMLMHIDCSGVVWVIPDTVVHIFSEVIAELGSYSDPAQEIRPGVLVVARIRGRSVRARVLEDEEDASRLLDIDSGEEFWADGQDLRQVSPSLLSKPPLAIPLKLYGVRKTNYTLSEDDRAAVLDNMGKKSSSSAPFWCCISLMEKDLQNFPLPANVRYTVVEVNDGNLALDLVQMGLYVVITSCSRWEKEVSDHGLDWMLDTMSAPPPLTFLPHPLPLSVGQWLHVSVEALEFPLEGGAEREPDLNTPDANRIGVQFRPLASHTSFDQHQENICQSLKTATPQIQKLNSSFAADMVSLFVSANKAEMVASPTVGQSVLAYHKFHEFAGEWCRGTVETIQEGGQVTIHYTDYGHRGIAEVGHLRSLSYQERMMPVQVREVMFHMPDSNRELQAVRLDLREEELMLMRVEKIVPMGCPMEMEQIMVSVWRAVDVG